MPTSHPHQISTIVELMTMINPKSMLDIGVGFGKYGFLAREYLDLGDPEATYDQKWTMRVDGIEGFPKYIGDVQRKLYDNIYIGDALTILPTIDFKYDLVLLIDVLEHFDEEAGLRLLDLIRARSRNVIVSTPRDIAVQGAAFGNELERHRFQWQKRHLAALKPGFFVSDGFSILRVAGDQAAEVRATRRAERIKAGLRRAMGLKSYHAVRRLLTSDRSRSSGDAGARPH